MINLNTEQQKVVDTLDKNIFLVAPAGTGKTNTLASRVANIINKNLATSKEILCITFTNKACKEMKERIELLLENNIKDLTVKTFHSFCLQVIKEQSKRNTDIATDFVVFDEEDCKECISKINKFKEKGKETSFNLDIFQKFINLVKEYRIRYNIFSYDDEADYRKVIENLNRINSKELTSVFRTTGSYDMKMKDFMLVNGARYVNFYNKVMAGNKAVDFNDLITRAKILFEDEEIVSIYRDKYKFINIDEMQDTSLVEYSIIEKLFKGDNKNILLCGDRFQTIYEWRGSNPREIFEKFKKEYNPLEIAFSKNYRSTQTLTKASMNFLENTFDSEVKETYKDGISANSFDEGEKISVFEFEDTELEAAGILKKCKELYGMGEDLSKVCILTRANDYNKAISKSLKGIHDNINFEFILVDEYKFFRRQEIKDILAFFKYIVNPFDNISLERIIKRLNTGIGSMVLDKVNSSEFIRAGIKLSDFISPYTSFGEFYSPLLNAYDTSNKEEGNIVIFDVESTGTDVTTDEIIQIAAITIDNNGNIIDSYERFIKPNKCVGSSEKVHGFSDKFLEQNGLDKISVLNEFREYTKGKIVVGHNVQYDINIFTSELSRNALGELEFKAFYDTLDIYRRFHGSEKNHKLEYLSERFNTKHKPSHDAMDDIKATKELLVMAIENDIRKNTLQRMSYISEFYYKFEDVRTKLLNLREKAYYLRPYELIKEIEGSFNLMSRYKIDEREEKFLRIENLHSILANLDDREKAPKDSLIEMVAISSLSNGEIEEIMAKKTGNIRIPIITVHQAKGLEFNHVFVAGLNEGLFPLSYGNPDEESKLFYVAITRAKKKLYLTHTRNKTDKYNRSFSATKSTFIDNIGDEFLEYNN